jgi:hypothetical protein
VAEICSGIGCGQDRAEGTNVRALAEILAKWEQQVLQLSQLSELLQLRQLEQMRIQLQKLRSQVLAQQLHNAQTLQELQNFANEMYQPYGAYDMGYSGYMCNMDSNRCMSHTGEAIPLKEHPARWRR